MILELVTRRERRRVLITVCIVMLLANIGCNREKPLPLISESKVPTTKADAVSLAPAASVDRVASMNVKRLSEASFQALSSGDTMTAYRLAREAMAAEPDHPAVIFAMAMVLGKQNRFHEAIDSLDSLQPIDQAQRITILGQTAQWFVLSGQWQEAEKRYKTIVLEQPQVFTVRRELAQLLTRQGRRLEAAQQLHEMSRQAGLTEAELRTLLSINRPFAGDASRDVFEPIGVLGNALERISHGKKEDAVIELVTASSSDAACMAMLGRMYTEENELRSLDTWSKNNSNTNPVTADGWFAWGVIHSLSKDDRAAVRCFCNVVTLDPTDDDAYEKLSEALTRIAATGQAKHAAERASLIRETKLIGKEMASSNTRDLGELARLARLLEELHRPLESLAWRNVQVGYATEQLSAKEMGQITLEIDIARQQILDEPASMATPQFVLCGVDIESLKE